jgi:hypothetical protein
MKIWIDGKYYGQAESARIEVSAYENQAELVHLINGINNEGKPFFELVPQKVRPLWAKVFRKPSTEL